MNVVKQRLFFALLFSLLLGLTLTACERDKAPGTLPALTDASVILAFGDSITYGTGASRNHSYPSQLDTMIAPSVLNAGVPGETTAGGLKRLPGVISKNRPDLVILCLGGNDFLKRVDSAVTRNNLAAMLDLLKQRGIPVMLIAVPRLGLGLTGNLSTAELYAELGSEYNVPVENDILSNVLSERDLKADPIHPNAEGYARIAVALDGFLRERGALAPR